jgi:hypothetical protein
MVERIDVLPLNTQPKAGMLLSLTRWIAKRSRSRDHNTVTCKVLLPQQRAVVGVKMLEGMTKSNSDF